MIHTAACDLLGISYPIIQAGMARYGTNAALVAAVSEAGGLGVLGCLNRPTAEATAEIARIRAATTRPFGVNFALPWIDEETFAACLDARVPVFCFFRGDPTEATARVHATGGLVTQQVTTAAEAAQARQAGVDVLIAQGTEAGGHMGWIPLFSLLPDVVAAAEGLPVFAAGGIVDGAGMAAALCLGAAGVVMGTRFLATHEAPAGASHKAALLAAGPDSTIGSEIFDIIWGQQWDGVGARALRGKLSARWHGREEVLRANRAEAAAALARAEANDDAEEMIHLAGMGVSRIHSLLPAAQVVHDVARDAAATLERLATLSKVNVPA